MIGKNGASQTVKKQMLPTAQVVRCILWALLVLLRIGCRQQSVLAL
jgi:hypothetical protein